MPETKKKRVITAYGITLLFVAMISVGVVLALMMKNVESRANNFTFSTIDVEVDEPHWDENDRIIYPGKGYAKDPIVRNISTAHELYVYLEVKIPVATVKIAEDNGDGTESCVEEEDYRLMTYGNDAETNDLGYGNNYESPEPKWVRITDKGDDTDMGIGGLDGKYYTEVYVYTEPLAPLEYTPALFEEITFPKEIIECQPAVDETLRMPITAYAVQSKNLSTEGTLIENLRKAFATHLRIDN